MLLRYHSSPNRTKSRSFLQSYRTPKEIRKYSGCSVPRRLQGVLNKSTNSFRACGLIVLLCDPGIQGARWAGLPRDDHLHALADGSSSFFFLHGSHTGESKVTEKLQLNRGMSYDASRGSSEIILFSSRINAPLLQYRTKPCGSLAEREIQRNVIAKTAPAKIASFISEVARTQNVNGGRPK